MIVGVLELDIRIEGSESLKDKRRVLQSLLERIRREYHAAAAEVGDHELWNSAAVGVSVISTNSAHAESQLQAIVDFCDLNPAIEVTSARKNIGPILD